VVVARHDGLALGELAVHRRADLRRVVAAGVARRYTSATRRELAERLGYGHPDSVGNLLRRFEAELATNASLQPDVRILEERLRKTENRV
jgi:hypothetical protein